MRLQHGHRIVADAALAAGRSRRETCVDEMRDQLGHVLAPLGKRRHAERHHAQAVEQVLAEAPLRRSPRSGRARSRRRTRTSTCTLVAPPTRWKRLIDEHAQDLVLRLARHVGDLVEIERAAVRLLERADLARPRRCAARCRTARCSMRSGVIAAALSTTNGPARALRQLWIVRATSSLPGAGRPGDHHAAVGRRDPLDRLAQMVHRRPSEPTRSSASPVRCLQLGDLALELGGLQRPLARPAPAGRP